MKKNNDKFLSSGLTKKENSLFTSSIWLSKSLTAFLMLMSFRLAYAQKLPQPPEAPKQEKTAPKITSTPTKKGENKTADKNTKDEQKKINKEQEKPESKVTKKSESESTTPDKNIPHGRELVSIDFPNGVNLSDIIKTIAIWTGKNFVLGQGVSGGAKISIISQEPVTKEEAYQAFLSALNISGFTTVETGKVVKILPIANAKSSNIKTYYGENWAPATDEIINHVVPLHYIDVTSVVNQLRPLLGLTLYAPFTTTNSLILTDTGNRIRRILEVIKLLDDKASQSQVSIVPVNYSDVKDIANKVTEIFGSKGSTTISLQKAILDERTNSLILVGPAHTLDDVVRFIQRIDKPSLDQSNQALVHVRPLDYADAEKLAATLQALTQNTNSKNKDSNKPAYLPSLPSMQPGLPNAGINPNSGMGAEQGASADISGAKITADKSTNSLIIQGNKAAYNELELIITQLDKRKAQLYIEATMLDLSVNHGLDWSPSTLGGAEAGGGNKIPFGFNVANSVPFTTTINGTSTASVASLSGMGSNAILGILSNKTVDVGGGITLSPGALIFALKSDSNTNVLQTPSMMVSDNESANFQSASEYNTVVQIANPNSTGTISSPLKINVQTSLKVTPQISRSDYVNLKINLQLDDSGPLDAKTGYPNPVQKRSAESLVTVLDGQTAVLGGITKDSIKRSESKVPLLGDIPILGWLFKSVKDQKEKQNLTLLLTPHVVRDAEDLSKIYEQSVQARNEYLRAVYGKKFKQEDFYKNLPAADAGDAPSDNKHNSSADEHQKNIDKNNEYLENRKKVLPSEESNPINAPTTGGGGGASGGYMGGPAGAPPPLPMQ
jgi:general secretion pathway protein D